MSSGSRADPVSPISVSVRIAFLLATGVAVFVAASNVDTIPYGRAFWDLIAWQNGAYRIDLGQIPHVDFFSPIGPLTLYLTLAAEHFFPRGQPLIGLHALTWLVLLPPMVVMASRFSSALSFLAALAILALITLAPYTLDQTLLPNISVFAYYNRTASALLFLLGLWYVLPKRRSDPFLLTYVLVVLFFLKATAAAAAIALLLISAFLRRATLRTVLLSFVGLLAVCLVLELSTGIVFAYLSDLAAMAAASEGGFLSRLLRAGFRSWAPLVICATFILAALWHAWTQAPRPSRGFGPAVATFWKSDGFLIDAAILVAMALAVESQNTGGVGLASAAAFLFHPNVFSQNGYRTVGAAVLGVALLLPMADVSVHRTLRNLLRDELGTTAHAFRDLAPGTYVTYETLAGARLVRDLYHNSMPLVSDVRKAGFEFEVDPALTSLAASVAWAEEVVDAAEVFREKGYRQKATSYASLGAVDPFSRLLNLTPAKGVGTFILFGRTMSAPTATEASRYLAGADGVFVPSCEPRTFETGSESGFSSVLKSEFRPLPLNACWTLYVRNPRN